MENTLKNLKGKKNGISISICAFVLSITLGMLVGCSVTKENTAKENIKNEDVANEDMGNESEQPGPEAAQTAPMPVDNSSNGAEDCQKIRTVLEAFAESYFDGDADAIEKFLASTYEGEVDTYEGTGMISDLTVKGLSDTDEKKIENGTCSVSIEFRDSNYEDMLLYLTLILVKEQGEWKIQFYGMEG